VELGSVPSGGTIKPNEMKSLFNKLPRKLRVILTTIVLAIVVIFIIFMPLFIGMRASMSILILSVTGVIIFLVYKGAEILVENWEDK